MRASAQVQWLRSFSISEHSCCTTWVQLLGGATGGCGGKQGGRGVRGQEAAPRLAAGSGQSTGATAPRGSRQGTAATLDAGNGRQAAAGSGPGTAAAHLEVEQIV